MKIVIAPNAFKDSLSAVQISEIIARRIKVLIPEAEILQLPVADGGDGLMDIALYTLKGKRVECLVRDPLDRQIRAEFCYLADRQLAVIEMAAASGLRLLSPGERNPVKTSTKGTGDLIKAAMDLGASEIMIGLGGSATNDGGCGMASVLGYSFIDARGKELDPCGGTLINLASIDDSQKDSRLRHTRFSALCDVNNPLLGSKGAAEVYGPQKGASPEEVRLLEKGLAQLADCLDRDLGKTVRSKDYSGAAGGFGAGAYAFLNAELRPGINAVLELNHFDEALEGCDLVITGEGELDEQTVFGKAPAGVAAMAAQKDIPCLAISGSRILKTAELHQAGITSVFSICPGPVSLENAMENAGDYVKAAIDQILRCYLAGKTGNNSLNSSAVK